MGEKVNVVISNSICALENLDIPLSVKITAEDELINQLEHNIEKFCLNMIALQQPIAKDLRMVTACLKIITDIERIADHCADICDIIKLGKLSKESTSFNKIVVMMNCVHAMFKDVLKVFLSKNVDESVSICKNDDNIDSLFSDIVLNVCNSITKDSSIVSSEIDLLLIAKYIERIGDHCTNIAEWVIYVKTGRHPELN